MTTEHMASKRRSLKPRIRARVLSEAGGRCANCGFLNNGLDIDHIIPVSSGGKNNFNNLQALCQRCHSLKTYMQSDIGHGNLYHRDGASYRQSHRAWHRAARIACEDVCAFRMDRMNACVILDDEIKQTVLALLREQGSVTTSDLMDRWALSRSHAHQLLMRYLEQGLLRRKEGSGSGSGMPVYHYSLTRHGGRQSLWKAPLSVVNAWRQGPKCTNLVQ